MQSGLSSAFPVPAMFANVFAAALVHRAPALEAQHRNRIALAAGAAIGLAVVAAVSPQPAQTAVRAGIRAVDLRGRADRFQNADRGW